MARWLALQLSVTLEFGVPQTKRTKIKPILPVIHEIYEKALKTLNKLRDPMKKVFLTAIRFSNIRASLRDLSKALRRDCQLKQNWDKDILYLYLHGSKKTDDEMAYLTQQPAAR